MKEGLLGGKLRLSSRTDLEEARLHAERLQVVVAAGHASGAVLEQDAGILLALAGHPARDYLDLAAAFASPSACAPAFTSSTFLRVASGAIASVGPE